MDDSKRKYANMQLNHIDSAASSAIVSIEKIENEYVVGSFDAHNKWEDYKIYLFLHPKLKVKNTTELVALDFACGPGRNILLFKDKFKRIDGVDISQFNLRNAEIYTSTLSDEKKPRLFLCNGLDLQNINSESYDVVFSTIALQHICSYSIRLGYLREFYRILKPGGFLCVQMGYGEKYPENTNKVKYHTDFFEATSTNGSCDTRIESPMEVRDDLDSIGFTEFEYHIRPTGPGDFHPNWIFWSAMKEM